MKEDVKGEFIGFRVSAEAYRRIEEQARLRGEGANEWCRNLILSESAKGFGLTAGERAVYEQVGVIRHLFGRYLRRVLPPEEYQRLRSEVEHNQAKIADLLLARRSDEGKK